MEEVTRGIRNRNPFNIRYSNNSWLGKVKYSKNSDKVFEQFLDVGYGLRAGILLLRGYINRGFDTPRTIINRFAPSSENDVDSYLKNISNISKLTPDTKIIFNTFEFFKLCQAICYIESLYTLDLEKFRDVCERFRICKPFLINKLFVL